jgi:hypothetical protein
MMQHLVVRLAWTARGIVTFRKEVNTMLREGWVIREMSVVPGWPRSMCIALMETPPDSNGMQFAPSP